MEHQQLHAEDSWKQSIIEEVYRNPKEVLTDKEFIEYSQRLNIIDEQRKRVASGEHLMQGVLENSEHEFTAFLNKVYQRISTTKLN